MPLGSPAAVVPQSFTPPPGPSRIQPLAGYSCGPGRRALMLGSLIKEKTLIHEQTKHTCFVFFLSKILRGCEWGIHP
jgi:hypothetical protein